MPAAVSLCVAAACLAGAAFCYRRRDGVLRFMTRLRGYESTARRCRPMPPGPRRRYQRGPTATLDMLSPVVALLMLGLIFLVSGVAALR